ncbi:MAG: hypothetical protein JSS02_35595 [Planctomycetes bacterium]|nr:hypothetical protein [Planctomycetota bacterium]
MAPASLRDAQPIKAKRQPQQIASRNKRSIALPFANAQPRPEVLRAKRTKRAKGQPGQSDAPIRLRANEQRSFGGLCSLCSQPFSRSVGTSRDFVRLLARPSRETVATISGDWPTVAGKADAMPQQTGWHDALFVEADLQSGHRMEFDSPEASLLQNRKSNNSW